MTGNPHPSVMTIVGKQRCEAFRAQADRERLARLAANHGSADRRPPWADLVAVGVLLVALALVLAVGSARAEPSPQQDRPRFVATDERTASRVLEEHLLDPTAALAVHAARL